MLDPPRIAVRIADDGLTATVAIRAGAVGDPGQVELALGAAGVSRGINWGVCTRLGVALADPRFACIETCVASGQAPVAGTDGRFDPAFAVGPQAGVLREDGTMDFHERGLLAPVAADAVLGRLHPATQGQSGVRVDGKELIAAAGRPLVLQLGAGVTVGADGAVRATRAGVVRYKPDTSLDVVTEHVHAGDVDLHSGNLHMEGSLVVKGNVTHSFQVHASGDVDITGSVDSGSVHVGGSLRVRLGVRGGDGAMVTAAANLVAHHAEAAVLHAGGTLNLEEAVHSQLSAERIVIARRMRGGSAQAEHSIVVGEAGTPQSTQTTLWVGEPIEHPVAEAQRALAAAKAYCAAGRRSGATSRAGAERTKGGKQGRTSAELQADELAWKLARAARRDALLPKAYIEVGKLAHAGVVIRIGDKSLGLPDNQPPARFSYDAESRSIRVERKGT